MSTPSSSTLLDSSSRPASLRTDKRELLQALATELKKERQRSEESGAKMVRIEAEVEEKHRLFLSEEARLSAQRDANNATIAALRRDLARAKQSLEEASHVREEEAAQYLALLSGEEATNGHRETASVPPSSVGTVDNRQQRSHPSQLPAEIAVARTISPHPSSQALPHVPLSSHPSQPIQRRSARPDAQPRPTSLVAGHPYQSPSPYHDDERAPFEKSEWKDSLDEARQAGGGVEPPKAKGWGKVFPSLRRRGSSADRG
ncbi:hypothetical protein JCM1840_007204 [Sporobolomyces johnsonii]